MQYNSEAHILIHPRKGRNEKIIPEKGLLLVNPTEATACHRQLEQAGGEARFLFNSGLTIAHGETFFLAGPSIGAPMAALTMEKCIALGAKRIILFGWCGAISSVLKIGDIILPTQAVSGEGTSPYYPGPVPAVPSSSLREHLAGAYAVRGVHTEGGIVWSTDAIYREDRRMLQELHEKVGIVAVDMEFSALCAVAAFRKIEFAAVLVVSDELWGASWHPGFSKKSFQEQREKALAILFEFLRS